jgi:hypothetical protein
MEKNKFNPINYLFNKDDLEYEDFLNIILERIEFSILNCGCTCRDSLSRFNINRNKDILENIINLGMMDKYVTVSTKSSQKKQR